jgi:hypothetical protein
MMTVNLVKRPTSDSSSMVPPIWLTSVFVMYSPKPVPSALISFGSSSFPNIVNRFWTFVWSMPVPVSKNTSFRHRVPSLEYVAETVSEITPF